MPDRNVKGLDALSGSQNRPNRFRTVTQRNPGPLRCRHVTVRTEEPGLCHPDRPHAGQHPEMRSQSETARVGNPLPITENDVGQLADSFERVKDNGNFTKRQQSRNVGELDRSARAGFVTNLQIPQTENRNSCRCHSLSEAYIDTRDKRNACHFPPRDNFAEELPLNLNCLWGRDLERMQIHENRASVTMHVDSCALWRAECRARVRSLGDR